MGFFDFLNAPPPAPPSDDLKKNGPPTLSMSLDSKLGIPKKEVIHGHYLSCMRIPEDCDFCRKMDGVVFSPDDPLLKHVLSEKMPDKKHPYGYRPAAFQKLCSCPKGCVCAWVDIFKDEEFPPEINVPGDLRKLIESKI